MFSTTLLLSMIRLKRNSLFYMHSRMQILTKTTGIIEDSCSEKFKNHLILYITSVNSLFQSASKHSYL